MRNIIIKKEKESITHIKNTLNRGSDLRSFNLSNDRIGKMVG